LSGLVVTALYSDGSTSVVTSSVATTPAAGATLSTVGSQSVEVSFTDSGVTKTASFTVTVAAAPVVLSSIAVTTMPTKTAYTVGDVLDLSGMVVTAMYSDGSTSVVTSSVTTTPAAGATLSTVGTQSVQVSYTDSGVTKTASFNVTVAAAPLSSDSSLASLAVSGVTLLPPFDPAVKDYTATVANIVGSVTVTATPSDGGATVTGTGVRTLAVGANLIQIVVKAADGTSTTYTVTVTRAPFLMAALAAKTVRVGDVIRASATGFAVGEQVKVTVYSNPYSLGTMTANAQGAINVVWTVPEGISLGNHSIEFVGASSGTISAAFTVQDTPAQTGGSVAPAGGSAGVVVSTGGTVVGWFAVGLAVLLLTLGLGIGGAAVRMRRVR